MSLFDSNRLTLTVNHDPDTQTDHIKGEYIAPGTTELDNFFGSSDEPVIDFDEQYAQIYYPVKGDTGTKYVLYIRLDTTGYFAIKDQIAAVMTQQVYQSSLQSTITLTAVLAVLLFFTVTIVFMVNQHNAQL